jgi:ribonuclease T1
MPADQRRTTRLAMALLAVAVVLVVWWWADQGSQGQPQDRAGGGSSARSAPSTAATAPTDGSRLARVQLADLPAEARRTLDLIAAGGPYPYSRDGVVFQNRERQLPRRAGGYYHEYTVPTPGEADRGARRIITGQGGERFWTPDHYTTFSVIVLDALAGGGS